MSRRQGSTIATLNEDMWCFEPVIACGVAETPQYFLDGNCRYPRQNKTLEATRNAASREKLGELLSGMIYLGGHRGLTLPALLKLSLKVL